jgi:hypothetical protein
MRDGMGNGCNGVALRLLLGSTLGRSTGTPAATLALARRCLDGRVGWARSLTGDAGGDMRSGLACSAGLPATLAFATPGFLTILARCRRRPVRLRLETAFGVFHVVFFHRAAQFLREIIPGVCCWRSFDFALEPGYQRWAETTNSFSPSRITGFCGRSTGPCNFFQTAICNRQAFGYKRRTAARPCFGSDCWGIVQW